MTYYIDPANGRDDADGTSPKSAAKSVAPAWQQPGVTLLYKRGSVIRGCWPKFSGTPDAWVTIGAYGDGEKPIFTKSISLASPDLWTTDTPNIWRCTKPLCLCANIIYDDEAFCGAKRWKKQDLVAEGDWFDQGSNLFVFCRENPGRRFRVIEWVPSEDFIRFVDGDNYITVQDVHIRNAGVHGFWVSGGHHIVLRRCDVSYVGGAVFPSNFGVPEGLTVRYGNAFEIWRQGHHVMIEGCRAWEIYDGAVCLQGLRNDLIHDVSIRGCLIWNSSFDSFDWSWGVKCENVYFENNTCLAAGKGWGYLTEGRPRLSAFLPDAVGWHVFFTDVTDASSIVIRNNIFSGAPDNPLMKFRCPSSAMKRLTLDYNCYHQPNPRDPLVFYDGRLYGQSEFTEYHWASGFDQHSIVADPKLIGFVPGPGSPCRAAGFNGPGARFDGMPKSQYFARDMGAPATMCQRPSEP
jgi:hypothetical protein